MTNDCFKKTYLMEMKLTKEIGKEKFQIHIPMSKHNKKKPSEAGKMMP